MLSTNHSEKILSIALAISAAIWGLYWIPLRTIENAGLSGAWTVVFFNACPLIVLFPLLAFHFRKIAGMLWPTVLAALMIGLAFTFYANALVETTVARAILLYFLTPVWATILGIIWLSEPLTKARILSIVIALVGLALLLSNGGVGNQPLNLGDLYGFLSGIFWAIGLATLNRWGTIPLVPLTTFIFIATTALSAIFAHSFYGDPFPDASQLVTALPTAVFWSIIIMLPSFFVIFRVSKILFPGRVGLITMSEVVVAIFSAAVLIPEETLLPIQ